jgi:hypothetical protein
MRRPRARSGIRGPSRASLLDGPVSAAGCGTARLAQARGQAAVFPIPASRAQLDERAGPPVGQDQRDSESTHRPLMDEVNADAVGVGAEVMEGILRLSLGSPVEANRPNMPASASGTRGQCPAPRRRPVPDRASACS